MSALFIRYCPYFWRTCVNPFEKVSKLSDLINKKIQVEDLDYSAFKKILDRFDNYPDLSKAVLEELR